MRKGDQTSTEREDGMVVLVSENMAAGMLPELTVKYPDTTFVPVPDDGELLPEYLDAEVLLRSSMGDPLFRKLLRESEQLQWVQVTAAGFDWILNDDLIHRAENGLAITRSIRSYSIPVAEFVIGALFHLAKRVPDLARAQQARSWERLVARDVNGSAVLIYGTGRIGEEVAWRARALGAHVIGVNRSGREVEHFDEVVPLADADAALPSADFVVLATPLTLETENMFGAFQLDAMRSDAYLINVGRGGLVVDEELLAALEGKKIAGAVLDVFREEPLPPQSPLWDAHNALITPHTSFRSSGNIDRLITDFCDNFDRYRNEQPLVGTMKEPRLGY